MTLAPFLDLCECMASYSSYAGMTRTSRIVKTNAIFNSSKASVCPIQLPGPLLESPPRLFCITGMQMVSGARKASLWQEFFGLNPVTCITMYG